MCTVKPIDFEIHSREVTGSGIVEILEDEVHLIY